MIKRIKQKRRPAHWLIACILLAESGLFVSCNGYDLDSIMPDWLGSSIYDYLNDQGNYTNEVRLINDLEYKDVLSKTGSKTLFVADDDAFKRFYANNPWGVRRYEDLTLAQKKYLLNSAMINDAYQTRTLSSTQGPKEGDCMRRPTATSIYDSIPLIRPSEMPVTSFWDSCRSKTEGILCLKDLTPVPMIHFLEKQLSNNQITNDDYDFLFNHTTHRQAGDASVNGVTIIDQNIKCMNGFIHKTSEVILPLDNMSEIIRKKSQTSEYSSLLERFSAPYKDVNATNNYNRLYHKNVDAVYQKRYFATRSQGGNENILLDDKTPVNGILKFDPGWNGYFASTVTSVGNDIALQENMAVMFVPTNQALKRYFEQEGGKVLRNYYGSWEKVPNNVIAKLINNNMHNSFISTIPSKFSTVLNDASNEMGVTTSDIDSVYLGCNGAIYLTNKVFSPTAYSSVSFPALVDDKMNIFYWGIEQLEYYAYLNSMESYYSFFIPMNDALTEYIDPVSFGQSTTKLYKFYYDPSAQTQAAKVKASIWKYNLQTGQKDSIGMATTDMIKNRIKDMLDQHIVIGNIESGNEYYQTKSGAAIRVSKVGQGAGHMTVSGGYQVENGQELTVSEIYDESKEGNGKTYILNSNPIMTCEKSVYDVLKAHPEFDRFRELLEISPFLETKHDKTYACGSTNISLFNTFQYTVYAPTNASIEALQVAGKLPTKEQFDAATETSVKDSIKNVVSSFLKYHIQDNSLFVGGGSNSGNFETACINPVNGRFYKLTVNADNNGITIQDGETKNGQPVLKHVTDNKDLRNLMAREYQYNKGDAESSTEIETSSYAVIHQIDKPLMYSNTQLGNLVSILKKR